MSKFSGNILVSPLASSCLKLFVFLFSCFQLCAILVSADAYLYRSGESRDDGWHYIGNENKGTLYPLFEEDGNTNYYSYTYSNQMESGYEHLLRKYTTQSDKWNFRYHNGRLYDCNYCLFSGKLNADPFMKMTVEGFAPIAVQYFIFWKLFKNEIKEKMSDKNMTKKKFREEKKKNADNVVKWNIYNGKDPSRKIKNEKEEKDFNEWLAAGGLNNVRVLKNNMGEYHQILPNNIVDIKLIFSIKKQQKRQWLVFKGRDPYKDANFYDESNSTKRKADIADYKNWLESGGYDPSVYIPDQSHEGLANERSCFKCLGCSLF
ncbi:MAG: hypothetical protein FWC41_06000 [Firmicutes bacterium]|nr:hypothetical protein [Bacillota bacterium]